MVRSWSPIKKNNTRSGEKSYFRPHTSHIKLGQSMIKLFAKITIEREVDRNNERLSKDVTETLFEKEISDIEPV